MALPTAQLGGMASLSVPSYIPTVQVQKEPKAWEKLLLSVLANAAGSAVGQGVENVMSRDYADPAMGEDPARGLDKLVRGPKVNATMNAQRQDIAARKDLQQKDIIARGQSDRFNAAKALDRMTAEMESRIAEQGMQYDRAEAELGQREALANRQAQGADRRIALESKAAELRNAIAVERDRLDPVRIAQAEKLKVETEGAKTANELFRDELNKRRPQTAQSVPSRPDEVRYQERLANRAPDGKKYITVDDLFQNPSYSGPLTDAESMSVIAPGVEEGTAVAESTYRRPAGPDRNKGFERQREQLARPSSTGETQQLLRELLKARQLLSAQNEKGKKITQPRIDEILLRLDQLSAVGQ